MKKRIADWARSASSAFIIVLICLTAFAPAARAAFPDFRFTAESIVYERVQLRQVDVELDAGNRFAVSIGLAELGEIKKTFDNLSVNGVLQTFENGKDRLLVRSSLQSGKIEADLELLVVARDLSAELVIARQDLTGFGDIGILPPEFGWLSKGYLDPRVRVRFPSGDMGELQLQLGFNQVAFDSPDGRFAGDGLAIDLDIGATTDKWSSPRVSGVIRSGELLIDDFYRNFSDGALGFSFLANESGKLWSVRELQVNDNQALEIEGRATVDLANGFTISGIEINRLSLGFPGAYSRYIEPVLAPLTLDGLQVTGKLDWSGAWANGVFQSGDLEIEDLSIVDIERNRFAMTGLYSRLRPGDHAFDSKLAWRGLLVGKINLGSGEAALDSEPGTIAITEPLRLDVFGGSLDLHELKVLLPGTGSEAESEPDIRLRLDLRDLDMELLTQAFGWPSFAGNLSGHIPGVRLEDGILDLEGKILVNVFDGIVSLNDLRIERPFGVLPSLAANIEVEDLDLELLTSTFSFGRISGRLDGYVRELRMLDWRPVAFDAWLGTPETQKGSKGISRQAVNHLTTLGGGSATTALTSPLMKLFNNFSYKRLGFGCRMQNNVCEVRGVSEDDVSVLIMEGAGVPKITIRAFNRTVDWPQLLAHLAAASEGEGIRVGD
jgi:hypothetical protein